MMDSHSHGFIYLCSSSMDKKEDESSNNDKGCYMQREFCFICFEMCGKKVNVHLTARIDISFPGDLLFRKTGKITCNVRVRLVNEYFLFMSSLMVLL